MSVNVTDEQVAETLGIADSLMAEKGISRAAALLRAARKVAGRHRSMPGPILGEIRCREATHRITVEYDTPGYYAVVKDRDELTRHTTGFYQTGGLAEMAARRWIRLFS